MYVSSSGDSYCDCDDGWAKRENKDPLCYQEFTRGFCGEEEVVRILRTVRQLVEWTKRRGSFFHNTEFQKFKKGLERHVAVCQKNPCGKSGVSLPHSSTWRESGDMSCHKVGEGVDRNCLQVFLNRKQNTIECCGPEDEIKCMFGPVFLRTFSIFSSRKKCRSGMIWSIYRNKCLTLFNG